MNIVTTIEFKSLPEFFVKEADGRKPNTTRIVSVEEDEIIAERLEEIEYIRIANTNEIYSKQSIVRRLKDISRFKSRGLITYIFSW